MYIGTRDGIAKKTYYTNPQHGGSFEMRSELLQKYSLLLLFTETKPTATTIIHMLFRELNGLHIPVRNVCPEACMAEMRNIELTRDFIRYNKNYKQIKHPNEKIDNYFIFYEYYSSKFLNYTLVMHPVGRHYDVFADNKPSLENRICFCLDKMSDYTMMYGRGGCGLNKFCFAILDWRSSDQKQNRDVWTSEKYKNLKYSSYWYAKEGKINQRLTKDVWNKFVTANPSLKDV